MNKISVPSPVFRGKHYDESVTLQTVHTRMSTRGRDLLQVHKNLLV